MKKLLLLALVLCFTGLPGAAQFSANSGLDVFAYSADQLATRFAGKTRKEVLNTINKVRTPDTIVTSTSGKEYALVRYDEKGDIFRIFLFNLSGAQKLVAVADDAQSALAMEEKYGIKISLPAKEVAAPVAVVQTPAAVQTPVAVQAPVTAQTPAPQTYLTSITDMANNRTYTAYQSGDKYLVYRDGAQIHTFNNHEYNAFMATIANANSNYQENLAQQQANLDRQRAQLEQERLWAAQRANTQNTVVVRSNPVVPFLMGTAIGGLFWNGIWYHHHSHHHRAVAPAPHRPIGRPPHRW